MRSPCSRLRPHPPLSAGPSIREMPTKLFMKQEIKEARDMVNSLDAAVAKATSFREKASRLLEEASRALSRLEQVRRAYRSAGMRPTRRLHAGAIFQGRIVGSMQAAS